MLRRIMKKYGPTLYRGAHRSRAAKPIALIGFLVIVFAGVGVAGAALMPNPGKLSASVGASRCGERPALPTPLPTAATVGKPIIKTTTVRAGETLSDIAKRTSGNANNWRAIAWLNRIPPPYMLQINQEIYLPLKR